MSAVASLTSSPQSLLLERIQQQAQSLPPPSDRSTDRTGRGPSDQFKSQFQAALQSEGIDPSQFSTIQGEIQDAVTKAAQGVSGSNRGAAIQSAVSDVLKAHGIDPAEFKSKLDSALQASGIKRHQHHHRASGGNNSANSLANANFQSANASGTDSDGDNDGSGASIADALRSLPQGSLVDQQA